jgi:alpha-methylacyl-CoA racemase
VVTGPLDGVSVVELAGVGPAPFAVMLLADMGASVVRVDRAGPPSGDYAPNPVVERGRRSIAVNLKDPAGVGVVRRIVARSDVFVESYRPGVAERLGLGPADCLAVNRSIVYGRMSGFGQTGPRAGQAGHDINYISLTGALHAIGRAGGPPVPPMNLVGDFGGGALFLAYGIACALLSVARTGRGQVVDANVVEGTTTLMSLVHGLSAVGLWTDARGRNLLDTGCPYYDVYACADGRHVAVGTIERRFFETMLGVVGVDPSFAAAHRDPSRWPALRSALTTAFAGATRDEWVARFAGLDACVTPVLDLAEARRDPQAVARDTYAPVPGFPDAAQAVPAPRFDGETVPLPGPAPAAGQHTREILESLGLPAGAVTALYDSGTVT